MFSPVKCRYSRVPERAPTFLEKLLRLKSEVCLSLFPLQHHAALFCINVFSWYSSSLPPIRQVKANTKKFLQIPSDPGLTLFHIHPPPLLFELIPLYSTCRLPSSLVRRVPSLPTLRDCVIQPEQCSTTSCRPCSPAPLPFPHVPPTVFVRNTVCQLPGKEEGKGGGRGGAQQDTLTRCGRDNHGGYGLPRPAIASPFPSSSPVSFFPLPSSSSTLSFDVYLLPPYLFLSRPPWRSSHSLLQQMLLLSFTLFSCPPPVGDIVIFRHSWRCAAMFVCMSWGC